MADLLPSTPDTSAADDGDPRVVGLDSDEADDVLAALSSSTARELLSALHEEPGTPSDLADRVDTSLQNTQYHLGNMEDADIVEVIDTAYSEKGREMKVYAPNDRPLVVFAGDEEKETGLRAALSRLIGGLGAVAGGSLLVQALFGTRFGDEAAAPAAEDGAADESGDGSQGEGGGTLDGASDGDSADAGATDDSDGADADQEATAGDDAGTASDDGDVDAESADDGADAAEEDDADFAAEDVETDDADRGGESADAPTYDESDDAASGADDGGGWFDVDLGDLPLIDDDGGAAGAAVGAGLPPGALFFAGGATVMIAWFVIWYARMYRA